MRLGGVIRWTLALVLAVVLHLAVLNIAPRREPVIQIEGGALQVQLGLDVAMEASTAGDAVEPPPAPIEPEPTPEIEPAAPQDNALIPTEIEPEPRSDPEPEPEPEPDPVEDPPVVDLPEDPPTEETEDATSADAEAVAAETEQDAEPATQEGDAAEDSVQANAGSVGSARPSTAPGNAASANYAGEVMQHLSRIRRPRASSPGSTMVAFTVALDGSLERLDVQRSSGSRRFDREALRMVERGAPFPRPPADVNRDFVVEIEGQ